MKRVHLSKALGKSVQPNNTFIIFSSNSRGFGVVIDLMKLKAKFFVTAKPQQKTCPI